MTKSFMLRIASILGLFLRLSIAFGQQNGEYTIDKQLFGTADGLASRDIYCGAQDNNGFMWFISRKSIQRFDGTNFKTYSPPELKNRTVDAVVCFQHYLILNAKNRGESNSTELIFDILEEKIVSFNDVFPNAPINGRDIFQIAHNKGRTELLVKNPFELWELTEANGFQKLAVLTEWTPYEPAQNIDLTQAKFNDSIAFLQSACDADAYFITNDHKVTENNGLLRPTYLSVEKNKIIYGTFVSLGKARLQERTFGIPGEQNATKNILDKNLNEIIFSGNTNESNSPCFAIESVEFGVYLFLEDDFVTVLDVNEYKTITRFGLNGIYKDNQDNYWIYGTEGLLRVRVEKNHFKSLLTQAQLNSLLPTSVRSIAKHNGHIYAGTYTSVHEVSSTNPPAIQFVNIAYGMTEHDGSLYVGTGSVLKIDQNFKSYESIVNFIDEIWCLHSLNDSIILTGQANGISIVNTRTKKTATIDFSATQFPEAKFTYRIFQSRNKGIVAAGNNGIYLIDSKFNVTEYFGYLAKDKHHHITDYQIHDAIEDQEGVWWIATNGEGLIQLKWKGEKTSDGYDLAVFDEFKGMPSEVLYRIEQDNTDNIWISSYEGLVRFNRFTHKAKVYTTTEGLCNNEFNRTSSYYDPSGTMYFGTINGVVAFSPQDLMMHEKELHAPFQLTQISKLNLDKDSTISCTKDFLKNGRIILEDNEKSLTLEFALLDFQNRKKHFAYRIEGYDSTWYYFSENTLRLNELPFGEFTLRIKAQLQDGTWNNQEIVVPISVLTPFYYRWWFYISVALLLLVTAVGTFQLRLRRIQKDNDKLEKLILQRTKKLISALQDKDLLIQEVHHRVKNNLQVISGLIHLQKTNLTDPNLQDTLNISQTRINAIALVHQNIYTNEELKQINFQRFTNELHKSLQSIYAEEEKAIDLILDYEEELLDIDTASPIGLVLNELLTNTYKHAIQKSNQASVKITFKSEDAQYYLLTYQDNGPGIPNDIKLSQPKTLGLQLITGLTKQLRGTVNYSKGEFGIFTIRFKNKIARKQE